MFDLDTGRSHQTAAQMQETIRTLKTRILELEYLAGQRAPHVFLHKPYPNPNTDLTDAMANGGPDAKEFRFYAALLHLRRPCIIICIAPG